MLARIVCIGGGLRTLKVFAFDLQGGSGVVANLNLQGHLILSGKNSAMFQNRKIMYCRGNAVSMRGECS